MPNTNYHSSGWESTSTVDDGEWHHVAVVFDHGGSAPEPGFVAGAFKIFIDGILEVNTGSWFWRTTTNEMWIGAGADYFTGLPGYFYKGQLDQLRVTKARRYTSDFTPPIRAFAGNITASLTGLENAVWYPLNGTLLDSTSAMSLSAPYGVNWSNDNP